MRTLLLLRHAKSSWDDPGLDDYDRPLAPRGREAAPRMGAYMRQRDLVPDLIVCSTAARAEETLRLLLPSLGGGPRVRMLKSLYLAPPSRLLTVVHRLPDEAGRVLMIGHNPGLEAFAGRLAVDGGGRAMRRLQKKFPTAALAHLTFEVASWREVASGGGRLEAFVRPKDIA